jgi:hypothetical protein
MGEAAGIAAELDLVEQLSSANAPFRPTARQISDVVLQAGSRWFGQSCSRRVNQGALDLKFGPFRRSASPTPASLHESR